MLGIEKPWKLYIIVNSWWLNNSYECYYVFFTFWKFTNHKNVIKQDLMWVTYWSRSPEPQVQIKFSWKSCIIGSQMEQHFCSIFLLVSLFEAFTVQTGLNWILFCLIDICVFCMGIKCNHSYPPHKKHFKDLQIAVSAGTSLLNGMAMVWEW